jgi:dolichol-phosphate mannosyltransferase
MRRRDNLLRLLSSRIANRVRALVLGDGTPDSACGLKAFARTTFIRLPRFDHMHRFLPALVRRQGMGVQSLEITQRARTGGRSKYGLHNRLWVGIVDLLGVWWLTRRALRPVLEEKE